PEFRQPQRLGQLFVQLFADVAEPLARRPFGKLVDNVVEPTDRPQTTRIVACPASAAVQPGIVQLCGKLLLVPFPLAHHTWGSTQPGPGAELCPEPHECCGHNTQRQEYDHPADDGRRETDVGIVVGHAEQQGEYPCEHDAEGTEHDPSDTGDGVCDAAAPHAHTHPPLRELGSITDIPSPTLRDHTNLQPLTLGRTT